MPKRPIFTILTRLLYNHPPAQSNMTTFPAPSRLFIKEWFHDTSIKQMSSMAAKPNENKNNEIYMYV